MGELLEKVIPDCVVVDSDIGVVWYWRVPSTGVVEGFVGWGFVAEVVFQEHGASESGQGFL